LDPLSPEVFIFSGFLRESPFKGTIVFERSAGLVTGFFLSTARTRNMRFSKIM
jgi:hypothetical protein